jgi:(p)ppGpp synthase/HD superfamily hydrolase
MSAALQAPSGDGAVRAPAAYRCRMVERTKEQPWQDLGIVRRAWDLAIEAHEADLRKGSTIPYVSHLWSVAALVLEHGGDDNQVAAALLHDSVEDSGGRAMLERIEAMNPDVADLVEHLSDSVVDTTKGEQKADWQTRKIGYLQSLERADARVLLVSACDKLHNARCILADHRTFGAELWTRFNVSDSTKQAWYYDSLARAFAGRVPKALDDELRRTVDTLLDRLRDGETPDLDAGIAQVRANVGQP